MDMWVGTRSAWHSKSLGRRCQTVVRMFPGCYYTRCALIRTDGSAVQTEATCSVYCVSTVCAVSVKEEAVLVREVNTIIEQYVICCKGLLQIADCNGSLFSMTYRKIIAAVRLGGLAPARTINFIRVVRRALNLLRASFSPIFQYFSAVNVTRVSFSPIFQYFLTYVYRDRICMCACHAPCAMDSSAMDSSAMDSSAMESSSVDSSAMKSSSVYFNISPP